MCHPHIYITFTFMHLADAFIQINFIRVSLFSLSLIGTCSFSSNRQAIEPPAFLICSQAAPPLSSTCVMSLLLQDPVSPRASPPP